MKGLKVGLVGNAACRMDGHVGRGIEEANVGGGGGGHGGTKVSGRCTDDHVGELFGEIGGEGSDGVSGDVGIGGKIHGHAAGNGWVVGVSWRWIGGRW